MMKISDAATLSLKAVFVAVAALGATGCRPDKEAPAPAPEQEAATAAENYDAIDIDGHGSFLVFDHMIQLVKEMYVNPGVTDRQLVDGAVDGIADYAASKASEGEYKALDARRDAQFAAGADQIDAALSADYDAEDAKVAARKKTIGAELAASVAANPQLMRQLVDYVMGPTPPGTDPAMEANDRQTLNDGFQIEYSILQLLEKHADMQGQEKKIVEAALNGMLTGLDPHSSFFAEAEATDFHDKAAGQIAGVGLEIIGKNGAVVAGQSIGDGPASKADIRPGDVIVKINGRSTDGMSVGDVADAIRGEVGTPVTLELKRDGQAEPVTVDLTRAVIKLESVSHKILPGENGRKIGYITMKDFNDKGIPAELDRAFADFDKDGGVDSYILNLRGNPGGLLDNALETADDFMNSGMIVSEIGRNDGDRHVWNAEPGDRAHGKPVTVLVDTGSASASEIVAGALQGNHRVTVVGSRSYGKGSVQTVGPFRDIPGTLFHFTTGLYLTPMGSIQGLGIVPDIEARIPGDTFERHESDHANMIANPNAPTVVMATAPKESCTLKEGFNIAALSEPYVITLTGGRQEADVPLLCAVAGNDGGQSAYVQFTPYVAPGIPATGPR